MSSTLPRLAVLAALMLPGPSANAAEATDRIVARPTPISDWVDRGLTPEAARLRMVAARRGIAETGTLVRHHADLDEYVIRVVGDPATAAAALAASGDFTYAEPDWIVHAVGTLPDDPLLGLQWHHDVIGTPIAWSDTTGDPAFVIAICDSGVDLDHPDLQAALVPGYNAVDALAQGDGGEVDALTDHGTQVAGTAAAIGNNATGVSGVGWSFSIMPVRVSNLPNDTAFLSDINAGARWAVDHGAQIINVSFSGVTSSSVHETGTYVRDAGGILVWAAGNSSASLGVVDPPDVLVVGATDQSDALASFSNTGRGIDVVAPGVDIYTTDIGGYGAISGTSFSSPMTAGVVGLAWSIDPTRTSRQIEAMLKVSAQDLGETGEDDIFGAGRISAAGAVSLALSAANGNVAPIAFADRGAGSPGTSLTIDVLANDVELDDEELTIAFAPAATPAGATIQVVDDALHYVAHPEFEGVDTFTYTCEDESALQAMATVTVELASLPDFGAPITIEAAGAGSADRLVTGDPDGDGDLDVFAIYTGFIQTLALYERVDGPEFYVGAGTLDLDQFDTPRVAFGDLNGDGLDDLIDIHQVPGQIGIRRSLGDFTFAEPIWITIASPADAVIETIDGEPLDFDGDGITDFAVGFAGFPDAIRLYRGLATNGGDELAFELWQEWDPGESIGRLLAADMDGDGDADLVSASIAFSARVFIIGANGTIVDERFAFTGAVPTDLALSDIDSDGDIDAITVATGFLDAPGATILLNDGTGQLVFDSFVPSPGNFPRTVEAFDLEADGDVDIALGHLLSNDVSLHAGIGNGEIVGAPGLVPFSTGVNDVLVRDIDDDGDGDLLVSVVSVTGRKLVVVPNLADPITGDIDGDGVVDFNDLLLLLADWGPCPPGACPADVNGDGAVGFGDLLILLGNWS